MSCSELIVVGIVSARRQGTAAFADAHVHAVAHARLRRKDKVVRLMILDRRSLLQHGQRRGRCPTLRTRGPQGNGKKRHVRQTENPSR